MNGLFKRLSSGLTKTREALTSALGNLFNKEGAIDKDRIEQIEEILVLSDMGLNTAHILIGWVKGEIAAGRIKDPSQFRYYIKMRLKEMMSGNQSGLNPDTNGPYIIMVVGVNGVGKTSTIGKLAYKFKGSGKSVMLTACDTFRAGAIEQLEVWAARSSAEIIKQKSGSDPSALAYDAVVSAMAREKDVLIVDTAGRLHTKYNLMEELKKMKRVIGKALAGAPHEIILVLDATTGQNALSQVRVFNEAVGLTGIIVTKLDGTAKGGIVVPIASELKIPIRMIGIGEGMSDLVDFQAEEFVDAMFGEDR
ncbi:MAG: signal recognition particle-docking protein FtsY [Nitrospirota bacterium]